MHEPADVLDGHSFFESISRSFIYFLFKLPAQHTVTDVLDIWVRAVIVDHRFSIELSL